MEIIEINSTQTQTESLDPDISRHPFSSSRMDEVFDIHRSFAQLAASMVSTQEVIQKERDLNRILAEENFTIKSKLQREQGSAKPEKSSRCETLSNETIATTQIHKSLLSPMRTSIRKQVQK